MKRGVPTFCDGRAVRERWKRLSGDAQAVLTAFALQEDALAADWVARLAREPRAVDELVAHGWIAERGDGAWVLAEEAERGVLTRLAPWSMRQAQHRALAELFEAMAGHADVAAKHWRSAGEDEAAFAAWVRQAIECAAADGVRAMECLEAAQVLLAGEVAEARMDEFVRAVEGCVGDPAVAAILAERMAGWLKAPQRKRHVVFIGRLAPVLAGLRESRGEHVAGAELRVKASTALRQAGEAAGAARQLAAATMTFAYALQYSAARQTGEAAVVAARESGDAAVEVEALSMLGMLLGMKGDAAGGRAALERALDLALEKRLTAAAAAAYRMLGTVAEYASCYGDEQAAFKRAIAYCRKHDERHTADLCLGCLAFSLFRSGNWARSRAIARGVLTRKRVPAVSRFVAEGVLGLLHAHRGELREAMPLLEGTLRGAKETGIYAMEFFARWGLALVEEQAGQSAAAALHYRALLEFWRTSEDRHDAIPGLTRGVLFFADRGDEETAREFASALRRIARETGNPEAAGAAAVASGVLQRAAGKERAALAAFEEALGVFESRELMVERVQVLARIAPVRRALGDEPGAARARTEASRRARRLGARGLFADLEEGERKEKGDASGGGWAGLSPRQRDVARQLRTGRTNKEIAAQLGVSVRTVDMHVAHVLRRLGCRTRAEAAAKVEAMLA